MLEFCLSTAWAFAFGVSVLLWVISQFVTLPFQMLVAFYLVRRHAHFKLPELFSAIGPSATVTLAAIAGPLAICAWMGFRFDYSLA